MYHTGCLQESVSITQSDWSKKFDGRIIFYLLMAKRSCPESGNNLSLHHLQAFVAMLWRVNISRGACSTWTVVLLQMVYLTVGTTWSKLHSLSSASNHVGYSSVYLVIHTCTEIIMVYI